MASRIKEWMIQLCRACNGNRYWMSCHMESSGRTNGSDLADLYRFTDSAANRYREPSLNQRWVNTSSRFRKRRKKKSNGSEAGTNNEGTALSSWKSDWREGTVGQNIQEYRLEYWTTRSSVRSFTRIAHSFACSTLLASHYSLRSNAPLHSLARSVGCGTVID